MRTFGQITYEGNHPYGPKFGIKCEPHIAIRLKRVFGKLATGSYGIHVLAATDENARDLSWFMELYPLEISDISRAKLEELTRSHRETEKFIQSFYDDGSVHLPFELALPAREYQKQAASLALKTGGLLLADDVGLGKTISAIAMMTEPVTLPAVVVTLAHLPRQWEREMNRFAPHLTTHIVKKGTPYAMESTLFSKRPDVLIMNYHKLVGWAETIASWNIGLVVFDECQELRRSESNKYAAAQHIATSAKKRIGLSATPIYNYGGEFYNVINILCPGKLGTAEEFYREWCSAGYGGNAKSKIKNPKAFGMYLRDSGIWLRRTRSEVKREIPPISKFHQVVDSDPEALNRVSKSCAELAKLILRGQQVEKGDKMRAAGELDNIVRQATGIAKAPYVASFVKLLVENGEKVVLYGWHRQVYSIWNDLLKEYNPVMFTGSESANQKDAAKEAFVSGDSQILIISLRAGAGLDGLQFACKTVVFGELDWSPGVHEQAIGRVARDGQADPVMAYFLVAETGSDPIVVDVLGLKKNQIEGVRNLEVPLFEKLQTDNNHIKRLAESYLEKEQGAAV